MDLNQNFYGGIYSNGQIYVENNSDVGVYNEGNIGITGDVQSTYTLSVDANQLSISVDGTEYVNSLKGIHVVVFDNNYMEVYDAVTLVSDDSGFLSVT